MATGVNRGKMQLAAFNGQSPKPPPIDSQIMFVLVFVLADISYKTEL